MTQNQDDSQWHLDKKVPLSLVFAMLLQAGMVVWAIADIKKDVEVLKATMAQQVERDNRQDRSAFEAVVMVRDDLKEVKALLTRILEHQRGAPGK